MGVLALLIVTAFYTTLSGLWGVLVTDLFQFVIKMGMVIVLAFSRCARSAAWTRSRSKVRALDAAAGGGSRLAFVPSDRFGLDAGDHVLRLYRVNWWATWYPGAEPGGGGYVAQRMFSAKNERDACSRRCGSTSRTTRCGRGRGF